MIEERFKYHFDNIVKAYGVEGVPSRGIFDPYGDVVVDIVEKEEVSYAVTKLGYINGNPVFKEGVSEERKSEILNDLALTHHLIFSEPLKKYMKCETYYIDSNFYTSTETALKEYDKKWMRSRKVSTESPFEFRELTKKDNKQVKLLTKLWRADRRSRQINVYFIPMYNEIISSGKYNGYEYKGVGVFYRGKLVLFRYYRVDCDKYCTVDMEHGANSFLYNTEIYNKYLEEVLADILADRQKEVVEAVEEIKLELLRLNDERAKYVESKTWKKVKSIDKEIEKIKETLSTEYKGWKDKEIENLSRFIKYSCVNSMRYHFMHYLDKVGITHYFEDFASGNEGLIEYKMNKNESCVHYYSTSGERID